MEFQYERKNKGFQSVCAGSMAESDEEETLSFCDMILFDIAGTAAELASTKSISNPDSPDHQDFHFDLDLIGGSTSNKCQTFSAEHTIFSRSIPPLSERKDFFSSTQNELMLNEKLQSCRSDSLESKSSSIWTNFQSSSRNPYYSALQQKLMAENSDDNCNRSNVMANSTSISCDSCGKTSSGWLQICRLGINTTPLMTLEDLRLRQYKRKEFLVDHKPVLKRSVSIQFEDEVTFYQRSKSVKETRRSKGFKIFPLFKSFRSCKSCSINSVIDKTIL